MTNGEKHEKIDNAMFWSNQYIQLIEAEQDSEKMQYTLSQVLTEMNYFFESENIDSMEQIKQLILQNENTLEQKIQKIDNNFKNRVKTEFRSDQARLKKPKDKNKHKIKTFDKNKQIENVVGFRSAVFLKMHSKQEIANNYSFFQKIVSEKTRIEDKNFFLDFVKNSLIKNEQKQVINEKTKKSFALKIKYEKSENLFKSKIDNQNSNGDGSMSIINVGLKRNRKSYKLNLTISFRYIHHNFVIRSIKNGLETL